MASASAPPDPYGYLALSSRLFLPDTDRLGVLEALSLDTKAMGRFLDVARYQLDDAQS